MHAEQGPGRASRTRTSQGSVRSDQGWDQGRVRPGQKQVGLWLSQEESGQGRLYQDKDRAVQGWGEGHQNIPSQYPYKNHPKEGRSHVSESLFFKTGYNTIIKTLASGPLFQC